ncbi:MAG: hypothetical protein CMI09_07065 [Oceanospirillaceae bacterium]|nr:hypothetical protein [Oceanospirillaceae bacterium]
MWSALRLLLISCLLYAIPALSAGPVLLPDTEFDDSITSYASVFEDTSAELEIADLLDHTIQRRFTPIHAKSLQFAETRSSYWIRFSIDNSYPGSRSIIVALSNLRFGTTELYDISTSGQYLTIPSSSHLPLPKGRYLQAQPYLISLPGKTTSSFLMKIESNGLLNSEIRLISPARFTKNEELYSAFQGLISGWLLATGAYFLHILLSRRLGLAGYAALYCTMGAALGNLWVGQFSVFSSTSVNLTVIASLMVALMLFSRSMVFYHFHWVGPTAVRSRWLSLVACVLPIMGLTFAFMFNTGYVESLLPATLFVSEAILLTTVLSGESKYRNSANLLISSAVIAMALSACVLLTNFNLLELQLLSAWSAFILPVAVSAILVVIVMLLLNQPITGLRTSSRGVVADARLLDKISQELTTPISNVIGARELLEDTQLTNNQKDYLEAVSLAALELRQVSSELSDMARVQDEHLYLIQEPFDVLNAAMPTVAHFRRRAKQRQVELLLDHEDDFNTDMLGDETRFKTLLYNLIRGLIDHLEEGSLSIHLANTFVGGLEGMCVQVRMTGKISQRDKLQAFADSLTAKISMDKRLLDQPWNQLILQQLLNFMKVAVEVETLSNRLASLTLYIPMDKAPIKKSAYPQHDDSLVGTSVLIVDDNAQLRKVLDKQVRRWGVRPQSTHNGKEALAILRNQCSLKQPFEALIMDQDMSTISALDMASKIQEDQEIIPKPGLIMLTSGSASRLKPQAEDAGIHQLVEKPVSSENLKIALMSLKYRSEPPVNESEQT